jgi:hypothetical protein
LNGEMSHASIPHLTQQSGTCFRPRNEPKDEAESLVSIPPLLECIQAEEANVGRMAGAWVTAEVLVASSYPEVPSQRRILLWFM